jgi:hypothetical protein
MPKVKIEKSNKIFGKGIINTIDHELIDRAAASASLNFLTFLDHIELIRGRKVMGADESGNTPVLGLHVGYRADGTPVMLRKITTKIQYYNSTTELWVDCKTGLIDGEELSFDNSFTPAGRQIWACGQDGLFKIYPSNLTSVITLTNGTKNYKGKIRIEKSRMLCVGMKEDPTGLRLSKVDKDANYTTITGEAVGALGSTHYAATLAHAQLFGLVITDGTQTLTDDKNGGFTGDGTGTVNYATGAIDVTFDAITTGPVVASYLYEAPLTNGLADFTYSATRLAGEGNVLRQDATGALSQSIHTFGGKFYTLQDKGSWALSIDETDLKFYNDVYNLTIGTPTWKSSIPYADGIIFIDTADPEKPKLRKLAYDQYNSLVVPYDLSQNFRMEDYVFDQSALTKFGDLVVFSCRTEDSTINNKTIVYHLLYKTFDILDDGYNFFAIMDNKLYAGDSLSPNVYEIMSGWDNDGGLIDGYWESKNDNLDYDQLKKEKMFIASGYMMKGQEFEVYASYDGEEYELLGSLKGTDDAVQEGIQIMVGVSMVGERNVGGEDVEEAYYFKKGFKIHTPKFDRIKIKFVPKGIGYLSFYKFKHSDIRLKGTKLLKKYK